MRLLTAAALIAATCAAGAPALAAPSQLNDVQFVEANRCLGLMSSKSIGAADAAATLAKFLKSQNGSRVGFIYDRADQARDDARREADRAGPENTRLIAERDGVCRSFTGASTEASGGHAASEMLR